MLAACRTQQNPDVQPNFDLTCTEVEGFLDQLHEFHQAFHSCFVRREPREHFLHYMAGQLSALERKSIEPMALHIEGGNIRGMQRFISEDVWKEDEMRQTYHGMVADEMGEPQGMMIFDESGFVKKGQDSVGVARQYCGTIGKVENCQVGVFAAYASSKGYVSVVRTSWTSQALRPTTSGSQDIVETRLREAMTPPGSQDLWAPNGSRRRSFNIQECTRCQKIARWEQAAPTIFLIENGHDPS